MEVLTMKKKIKVLEHAFAANAGVYYNINLTKDLVPGSIYQIIGAREYSVNEQLGLPENARFSDVVSCWGNNKLEAEERPEYFAFLSIPNLLASFRKGQPHVFHKYWTTSAVSKPMLAEQHIVMYEDEANGDILAITYVLDLTQKFNEEAYKKRLEEKQAKLERTLEELQQEKNILDDIIAEHQYQKTQLENALAEANLNSEIIGAISKIYWLIYRMDLVQGTYEEISAGHEVHRLTGKHGITAEVFKEVRETVVSSEHQEMMEHFLDTATLAERLKDTESIAVEYHAVSGSWHLGRFIVKKRDEEGRVTNVLYVVRQIDKQKQLEIEYRQKLLETAEEARRANIAKTDFLRRMSHDIRTPINGIQGMVAIADHYPDDMEKQRECRGKVKEASGFLLDLVNSILDMNKLESGTVVLERQSFDLIEVLDEANSITEMNGNLRGITISIDHSRIYHRYLIGSTLHFKQILQNIAGNAVKYNRNNGSIHLSTEELGCENGVATYRFICSDTGRGMSEEFLRHAFEPFSQEDASARTSYMGTGLGLSIAKQLAEMMGGTIRVQSEVNVGTTFTVTLPFELDTSCEKKNETPEVLPDTVLSGLHVLLTEDNDINIEIARFLLEKSGMEVTVAQNGKEALELFGASEKDYFDLILMDVMMPVMDGLEAIRRIRALERPDAKKVPIFAMTANAFAEDKKRSLAAGMNEHLSKPLNEEKLLAAIKRYVSPQN